MGKLALGIVLGLVLGSVAVSLADQRSFYSGSELLNKGQLIQAAYVAGAFDMAAAVDFWWFQEGRLNIINKGLAELLHERVGCLAARGSKLSKLRQWAVEQWGPLSDGPAARDMLLFACSR